MGCKFNGRTFVLVFVIFQLCGLYCVVWETMSAAIRTDHTSVYGEKDLGLYLTLFTAVELLVMLGGAAIIAASAVQYFAFKKILVLVVLGLNLAIALPFGASGLYLFFTSAPPAASLSADAVDTYTKFHDSESDVLPTGLKLIQEQYCCCGISPFLGDNSTTFTNSTCPMSTCKVYPFEGCDVKIPRKVRLLVLVASSIGAGCALVVAGISPFIYAYFEKDRRMARAEAIGAWQKNTTRIIELRQKALRRFVVDFPGQDQDSKKKQKKESNRSSRG